MFWLEGAGRAIWKTPLRLQQVVLIGLSLFMTSLIIAQIVFRYFLKIPLLWVEEVTIYVVFWFYFSGAAYAAYKRSHIKGGVLHLIFKNNPRVLDYFQVGASLISLGLSCFLCIWSYEIFTWSLEVDPRTTQLSLPLAYARLGLFVGFSLMSIYLLTEFIDSARVIFKKSARERG